LRPAFSPDDKLLAVPCQVAPPDQSKWAIYLVDPTGKIRGSARATGFIGDPSFDRTGTKIAFWEASKNNSNLDRIVEATVKGAVKTTPLTKFILGANDPTFSPVADTLAIKLGLNDGCEIYALDARTHELRRLTHNRIAEQDPSWSVDGAQIAYKRGPAQNADIWRMASNGTGQRGLITNGQPDSTPAWASR
jgi:Tol biopolymer transport system component